MIPWIIAGLAVVTAGFLGWMLRRARLHLSNLEQEKAHALKRITSQVDYAEQLRDELFKVVDNALLVLDAEQRILFVNPAAESLSDHNPIGQTLVQVIPQPDLESLVEDAQSARGEGVERRIDLGKQVYHARAIASSDEDHLFEILTLRDVTELQRLERARREMVSNITHELSTPITAIGLLADTLLNLTEQGKTKRTRKVAKDIHREVDTMTQLVQEIRDLSLIESGQMPVRLTSKNLYAIVQASVEPLLNLAENKAQTIDLEVPENIFVLADNRQIERVIKNIVHNAVKFTPEGGGIQVTATVQQEEAVIAVKDSGPGISAPDLPRIFERFYQVDPARREGTGLGLAIVRHIVMAHGGRVWAESIKGQGATFYITLALADESSQTQPGGGV